MSTRSMTEKGMIQQDATASLSFWQRHFYRSVSNATLSPSQNSGASSLHDAASSTHKPTRTPSEPRKFSFRSRGSVLVLLALLMVLIASAVTAIAITLTHHGISVRHHFPAPQDRPIIHPVDSTNSSTISETMAFSFSSAPVRLGVLENFPDPSIYYDTDSKIWYAIGTNDAAGILRARKPDASTDSTARANIQVATSTDFQHWSLLNASSDPLSTLGAWVDTAAIELENADKHAGGSSKLNDKNNTPAVDHRQPPGVAISNVWAPDVIQRPSDKQFVLYYSALDTQHHTHCLGTALSSSIAGPYKPASTPFACPFRRGGAIDPVGFIDSPNSSNDTGNTIYTIYKIDGNSRGHGGECGNTVAPIVPTPIMLQKMADDGVTPVGDPIQVLDRIDADGPLVEAPALAKVNGTYFLFYSSGCTEAPDYTVRYATADNIEGPYTRAAENGKLLQTGDFGLLAPGSVSVRFAPDTADESVSAASNRIAPGTWKMALHGRVDTTEGGVRAMFTTGLEFEGKTVRLVNATVLNEA